MCHETYLTRRGQWQPSCRWQTSGSAHHSCAGRCPTGRPMPPHSPASEHCTKMSLNLPLHLSDGSEEGGEVCVVVGGWGLGGGGGGGGGGKGGGVQHYSSFGSSLQRKVLSTFSGHRWKNVKVWLTFVC